MLNLRLARFEHLVDIGRVAELRGHRAPQRARRRSAPATRDAVIERDADGRRRRPAAGRGDAATSATSRSATGARSAGRWPTPTRRPSTRPWPSPSTPTFDVRPAPAARAPSPAADFFTGVWSTALEPDELLTADRLPGVDRPHAAFGVAEFARRHGDFAIAGAVAAVELGRRPRGPGGDRRVRRRRRRRCGPAAAERALDRPARRRASTPPSSASWRSPTSTTSPTTRRCRRPTAGGSAWRWSPRRGSGPWPRPRTEHDMADAGDGGADGERRAATDDRRGPQDAGRRPPRGPRASPAPTSAASTACAARARCCSTATPCARASMFAVQADGAEVVTVEGLAPADGQLSDVQQAMHAVPRPAVRLLHAGLRRVDHRVPRATTPTPTTTTIRDGLSGNLCRCTGYQGIIEAVQGGRGRAGAAVVTAVDERPRRDAGRQPLRRPARPAPRGRPPGHRPRHATSTTSSCPGCCTSRSCAATSPAARSPSLDVDGGPRAARRRRRVHRRRPQRRRRARRGSTSRAAPAAGRSACLAEGDVRFVGEPVALVVAESRYIAEDACDLVELDIEPIDADRRPRRRAGRRRPPGAPRARRATSHGAIPAAADPELDAIFAGGRARRHRDVRPAPLPVRADGVPRRRVASGTASATSSSCTPRPRAPHGVRGFLSPCPRPAREPRAGRHGRRRRRLRPEDVHAPRRAGRRARRQAARPTGEVDRGPPREPDGRPARPRRPDDGELRARRRRPHPRRRAPSSSRTSAPFPAAGSSAIGFVGIAVPGPVQDPPDRVLGHRRVYTNTCGRCSYRGPWMMETVVREQMMDIVARQLGIDPLELRRRNVVDEADLPYTTAAGHGLRPGRRSPRRSSRPSR